MLLYKQIFKPNVFVANSVFTVANKRNFVPVALATVAKDFKSLALAQCNLL